MAAYGVLLFPIHRMLWDGFAVGAWIRCAVLSAVRIKHNRVSAPHRLTIGVLKLNLMAFTLKLLQDRVGHARFDLDVAAVKCQLGKARGVERCLKIHTEIHNVRYKLRMRLRLVQSTHNSEADGHIAFGQ